MANMTRITCYYEPSWNNQLVGHSSMFSRLSDKELSLHDRLARWEQNRNHELSPRPRQDSGVHKGGFRKKVSSNDNNR